MGVQWIETVGRVTNLWLSYAHEEGDAIMPRLPRSRTRTVVGLSPNSIKVSLSTVCGFSIVSCYYRIRVVVDWEAIKTIRPVHVVLGSAQLQDRGRGDEYKKSRRHPSLCF